MADARMTTALYLVLGIIDERGEQCDRLLDAGLADSISHQGI
ncbi:hypothetical protein ABZX90_17730 [Streptomyces sp. NPDC002935]